MTLDPTMKSKHLDHIVEKFTGVMNLVIYDDMSLNTMASRARIYQKLKEGLVRYALKHSSVKQMLDDTY